MEGYRHSAYLPLAGRAAASAAASRSRFWREGAALQALISLSTSGWITAGTKDRGACPSGAGAGAQFCCASLSRTLSGSPLERGARAGLRKALAEELLRWQVRLWWVRFPRVEERRAQMTHCNCLRVRGTSGIEPVEHGTKQSSPIWSPPSSPEKEGVVEHAHTAHAPPLTPERPPSPNWPLTPHRRQRAG